MLETEFQYYPSNVRIPSPLGTVTLQKFLDSHKNPTKKIKNVIDKIRVTKNKSDKEELKKHLFYFTPSVFTDGNGRSYENIQYFTGFMVVEFDKISYLEEFKAFIFDRVKSCICAYISPSGKGVKTLMRIPVVKSIEQYKEYFYGMAYYMEKYVGFDPCNQNPALPLFISYDNNLLFRENPKVWKIKGEKINEFKESDVKHDIIENVDYRDVITIKKILKSSLSKIKDQGHPIVRSTALIAGGYVGAGYMQFEEMQDFLFKEMDKIDYLWKGMRGYKQTCIEMLQRGMLSPITLEEQ